MVGTIVLLIVLMVAMYTFFIALCRTSSRAADRELLAHASTDGNIESATTELWLDQREITGRQETPARRKERTAEPIVV